MYVQSMYRYPVKGLSPEQVSFIDLVPGEFFPGDRIYAVENGPSGFDPQAPAFRPKTRFLMLMEHPRLAELASHFDHGTHVLALAWRGAEVARGDLRTADGRRAIGCFLQDFCAGETRGPVRLLAAPEGFRFTDSIRSGFVSILNLGASAIWNVALESSWTLFDSEPMSMWRAGRRGEKARLSADAL